MTTPPQQFEVRNPGYAQAVGESFARQQMMCTIGAELARVEPGVVEIALRATPAVSQQNGFVHAGALATIADTACGYASLTLMPPGSGVLSIEFKINLLRPARGEVILARADVVRPGSSVFACRAEVFADEVPVAMMQGTMIRAASEGA